MSIQHDMKLVSRDRIFLSRNTSVDLTEVFYHVARHVWMFATQLSEPTTSYFDVTSQVWSIGFYSHSWDKRSVKQACSRYIINVILIAN